MLKQKLISFLVIGHPDFSKEFIFDTDASKDSVGGLLSQEQTKRGSDRLYQSLKEVTVSPEKNYLQSSILSSLSDIF